MIVFLARIYGYETRAFNQQVKRNLDKFPEGFMFQLTKLETDLLLKSQNVISSWGVQKNTECVFRARNLHADDGFKR